MDLLWRSGRRGLRCDQYREQPPVHHPFGFAGGSDPVRLLIGPEFQIPQDGYPDSKSLLRGRTFSDHGSGPERKDSISDVRDFVRTAKGQSVSILQLLCSDDSRVRRRFTEGTRDAAQARTLQAPSSESLFPISIRLLPEKSELSGRR